MDDFQKELFDIPKQTHPLIIDRKIPSFTIAVDFDGTCVTHEYPIVGKDIGAVPVLKMLTDRGHKLILFTMRSGKPLAEAQEWFHKNGIPLYGVNTNPTQQNWTSSPKAYAQVYIDDAALGTPLKFKSDFASRPFVDWEKVRGLLIQSGIL
jgi:hypothetical protein